MKEAGRFDVAKGKANVRYDMYPKVGTAACNSRQDMRIKARRNTENPRPPFSSAGHIRSR